MERTARPPAAPDADTRKPEASRSERRGSAKKTPRAQQGVQSVEIGLRVAFALAEAAASGPTTLGEIARHSGLSASKTHRYLVSLCRTGLAEQVASNGRYALGHALIPLGLAALNQLDEYRYADEALDELVGTTGVTAMVMTWGSHGSTLVRRREPPGAVVLSTKIGSVVSTVFSSSGRLFAALLPAQVAAPFVDAEFAAGTPTDGTKPITRKAFRAILERVRERNISWIEGDLVRGIDGLSAPVFDHEGRIVLALTIMAMHGARDLSPEGQAAQLLKRVADDLSRRIGFRGGTVETQPKKPMPGRVL
jgi:DNA-binding IclR family transcriptional regulator